ncbi:Proteophosphoglycan 5 [Rhodotorula toruloides ATCC 204091]|uniref:Proteophosphoglycan 5 n=1 Tax=Rhodotorula toruloides TaxID=5286 RepID=A0A0K3CMU2_RHOTO|nr:Proteophosphoglycan 5 [Rhodotorula toruloides ATCC 204091]KAK4333105.1 Proteophosphoglycan 5 [Rhodotorula toruloides]PRQ71254.1 Proteophosphoglycan 5 [Rhodotorula toruloides]
MPSFASLDPSIPHTLAPSSPLPSTFTAQTHTLAARLSRTDAPRRKNGVVHHAPQGLGLPELICTGVEGDWEGRRPAWVDAERGEEVEDAEKLEEKEAWRELGVEGIPRDMDEWEDWERVKRGWREERQKERVRAQQAEEAAIITKKLEALVDRSTTDKRRQESTASASTASTSRPSQPTLLTSHFSSSKATVSSFASGEKPPPATSAADSSKKKRPPSSPPVPPPHRHTRRSPSPHEHEAPAPTGKSGDSGKSGKESFPSLSSINSAGRVAEVEAGPIRSSDEQRPRGAGGWREASGEDEEILFEGGYTQMVLPDPTPSARPTISTSAAVPARPSAHSALSPHPPPLNPPWSSPGLHGDPDDSHGKSSTPVPLARPQPLPRIQTSTSSRSSRFPSPPHQAITDIPPRPAPPSRALTNFSTTTTSSITNGPLRPTVARLSELARTGSALSVRSNGSEAGEGMREIERFLEEEARE